MKNGTDRHFDQLNFGEDEQLTLLRRAWRNTLQELAPNVAHSTRGYLDQIVPSSIQSDHVELLLEGQFAREWLNRRHKRDIEEGLSNNLGRAVTVQIVAHPKGSPSKDVEELPCCAKPVEAFGPPLSRPKLNSRYTFDQFVEGGSNRLAYACSCAVVENPGKQYNPLFIYSTPGLGKTHLLHAIGQALLKRQPTIRILFMSAEEFLQSYVRSVRDGKTEDFRRLHRSVHIWLIDDIQFLGGRNRTQEEFFHLFNTLYQAGKQIVITSDRAPREIVALEERLSTRFEQGLCADIAPPDFELRLAILQAKAEAENICLPEEIAYFIADKVQSNIRALEGALTRLTAYSSLYGEPISVEMASEVLKIYFVEAKDAKVSLDQIASATCEVFQVTSDDLMSQSRKAKVAFARQVAMYLARELTQETWLRIAQTFGRTDHSTVIHAHKQTQLKIEQDAEVKRKIQEVKMKLYTSP